MLKIRKVLVEHVKSSNLLISSYLIFERNSIWWHFQGQFFWKYQKIQRIAILWWFYHENTVIWIFFNGNFLSKNNAWFLSVEFHPIFNSWFPYKTVNFHEIFDSTEIRLDGNLAKFKRNLSEFFLNFEPQKFNLCDSVSKKVRISYTFFRILTKFSWNLWISLKLDQFWKLWIK